jgi:hypothetical protein
MWNFVQHGPIRIGSPAQQWHKEKRLTQTEFGRKEKVVWSRNSCGPPVVPGSRHSEKGGSQALSGDIGSLPRELARRGRRPYFLWIILPGTFASARSHGRGRSNCRHLLLARGRVEGTSHGRRLHGHVHRCAPGFRSNSRHHAPIRPASLNSGCRRGPVYECDVAYCLFYLLSSMSGYSANVAS